MPHTHTEENFKIRSYEIESESVFLQLKVMYMCIPPLLICRSKLTVVLMDKNGIYSLHGLNYVAADHTDKITPYVIFMIIFNAYTHLKYCIINITLFIKKSNC